MQLCLELTLKLSRFWNTDTRFNDAMQPMLDHLDAVDRIQLPSPPPTLLPSSLVLVCPFYRAPPLPFHPPRQLVWTLALWGCRGGALAPSQPDEPAKAPPFRFEIYIAVMSTVVARRFFVENGVPGRSARVHGRPRRDPGWVHEGLVDGRLHLVVPSRHAVELVVRQEVVLQQARGERGVREAVCHRDQRHERGPQVFYTVHVLDPCAQAGGREGLVRYDHVVARWRRKVNAHARSLANGRACQDRRGHVGPGNALGVSGRGRRGRRGGRAGGWRCR